MEKTCKYEVAFLCDGKDPRCKDSPGCEVHNVGGYCRHTLDISHAVNFEFLGRCGDIEKWAEKDKGI